MKYCTHCGNEIHDEAVVCVKCGCAVEGANATQKSETNDTLAIIIKIFMVLGCVAYGWTLIPLIWCIPLTIKVFKCLNEGTPISTGVKVCSLLFVNLIAGICMLCMNDK